VFKISTTEKMTSHDSGHMVLG